MWSGWAGRERELYEIQLGRGKFAGGGRHWNILSEEPTSRLLAVSLSKARRMTALLNVEREHVIQEVTKTVLNTCGTGRAE